MPESFVPKWVWASLVLTAVASFITIMPRYFAERENKTVGLLFEADNIRQAGAAEGKTYQESLKYLADHGLTGVVMGDVVLGDAVPFQEGQYRSLNPGEPDVMERYNDAVSARLERQAEQMASPKST